MQRGVWPSVGAGGKVFLSRHIIWVLAILSLLSYLLTYGGNAFGPPIRADGVGYYAYLPALLIHADPSFQSLAHEQFEGDIPAWTGLRRHLITGRYLNKYNMGVSLLMLPFFLLAHLGTWLMQSPPGGFDWWKFHYALDGYSLLYQHAAGLSGVFYFVAGCAILKRILERYFSTGIVLWTLLALIFGTNLYHYGTGETVFSSPYSFFLVSAFLWTVIRWHEHPDSLISALCVGGIAGLIIVVRLNNVFYWVLFPLFGLSWAGGVRRAFSLYLQNKGALLTAGAIALLMIVPQVLYWKYSTGRWLVYSYQNEGFNFLKPEILNVLFSLNRGVLFWTPLLALAVAGFFFMKGDVRCWRIPMATVMVLQLWLVASWHQWWWGGSLGHRAFIESYALLAFPLASLFSASSNRAVRSLLIGATAVCILWSLFFMKLYYTRELSYHGLDCQALFDIVWLRKEWIVGLFQSGR